MRDRLDQIWSQLSYYVDELLIRLKLAHDDPAVDHERRTAVSVVAAIVIMVLGIWWYMTHVLVTHQPDSARTSETSPIPVSSHVSTPSAVQAPVAASDPASDTVHSSECDPNYTPCVPNVVDDLNCAEVGQTVRVVGTDRYHLDDDSDGYGCDSYSN